MNYEFEYTKTLEEAGLTHKEAEATIKTVLNMMESKMASKSDLERAELKLSSEMKIMEYRIVNKVVGALSILIGLGFTALALVLKN